jgi:hypothetical protein
MSGCIWFNIILFLDTISIYHEKTRVFSYDAPEQG